MQADQVLRETPAGARVVSPNRMGYAAHALGEADAIQIAAMLEYVLMAGSTRKVVRS
jgi:hypothetical protein